MFYLFHRCNNRNVKLLCVVFFPQCSDCVMEVSCNCNLYSLQSARLFLLLVAAIVICRYGKLVL